MGWKEAKSRYSDGLSLTNQNAEDLLARRVLKGLGLRAQDIGPLEDKLLGTRVTEEALWLRVRRLMGIIWQHRGVTLVALEAKDVVKAAAKRMADAERDIVFCVRQKDSRRALAFARYIPEDVPGVVTPPFTVTGVAPGTKREWLVMQELDHYVRQYGTYDY